MMKIYFIIFFSINFIYSNSFVDEDCDVCQLNEYFNSSNGYGCFKSNKTIICTCPDYQQSTTNQPCRICHRIGICGPQNALCSEESTFFGQINNKSYFACFCSSGLFKIGEKCPEEMPTTTSLTTSIEETNTTLNSTIISTEETTTFPITTVTSINEETTINSISTTVSIMTTTSIEMTSNISLSPSNSTTKMQNNTTMRVTATESKGQRISSHLFVKEFLIILLNLVYFVNK